MKTITSIALLLAALMVSALAKPVRNYRLTAELIPTTDAIVPGETLTVCLNIKHDEGWHTYWRNPGIAGVPISLKWDLPEGFEAGEIQWARPERVLMAIYNTNGYEGEISLLIDIKTPKDLEVGKPVTLKTRTNWMMCSVNECYPSNADLELTITVAKEAKPHTRGKKLADATLATMPVENEFWETKASLGKKAATLTLTKKEDSKFDPKPEDLYFFSDDGLVDSHPEQTIKVIRPGVYKMTLPRAEFAPKNPTELKGVLMDMANPEAPAVQIKTNLTKIAKKKKPKSAKAE